MQSEGSWCEQETTDPENFSISKYECMAGDSLVWGKEDAKFTDNNSWNHGWRAVFTLNPDVFFEIWSPLMFGYIMLLQNFPALSHPWLMNSWPKCFLIWTFLALFCLFGYGGNLGIMTGFLVTCGLSPAYLALSIFDQDEEKTQLDIPGVIWWLLSLCRIVS